jgi:hypothetical protein
MLLHMSFPATDTARVSAVLAELLGGATVVDCPSPPFPPGSRYVCSFDERGSMVEVLPAGTAYRRGPGDMPRAQLDGPRPEAGSGSHALFLTTLARADVERIAAREGWPCALVDTGLFQIIAVWLEGNQLVELTNREMMPAYLSLWGTAGRDALDPALRAVEAAIAAKLAGGNDAGGHPPNGRAE